MKVNECPICGNTNLRYDDIGFDDDQVVSEMYLYKHCKVCRKTIEFVMKCDGFKVI